MNRRNFLRLIPAVITAGVIAPKLLIPEEPVKLLPLQVYTPTWIQKAEWDFAKQWQRDQERQFVMYVDHQRMVEFHKAMKECAKHYNSVMYEEKRFS